jgi:hypothetical protein
MANEPILSGEQAEHQREKVIEALTEHFAQDRLTMEQLEERLDKVYRANTSSALMAVLADLPAPPAANVPAPAPLMKPPLTGSRQPKFLVAFMSGVSRRGQWSVPGTINAVAFMGGVEIDLRGAELSSPVTDIHVLAVMGGVEITVPPGVRVESNGFAIMGGFEDSVAPYTTTDPNAPLVRVSGFALMGGVEVRVLSTTNDASG